ncbi:MAG: hypothetical protein Q8L55_15055, partial [Phycisphaerales bacterium]|nr:hypothetical protein [Phycisphaerales bacterium]
MSRHCIRSFLCAAAPLIAVLSALGGLGAIASAQCGPTITGHFGGETTAFTRVNADTLLVANGTHVELVSVFNSFEPMSFSPRRTAPLNGPAVKLDMTLGSGRAYALLKNGDVQVFSLANAPGLTVSPLSTIASGDAVDIAAAGNTVFIATQIEQRIGFDAYIDSELYVYDATLNPAVRRQTFEPLTDDYGYDRLVVVGSTLWTGFHELESSIYGVEGFNIANLASVTRGAAALNNVAIDDETSIAAMAVSGNNLIVGYSPSSHDYALAAVDVSIPSAPAWRPPLPFNSNGDMTGLATSGALVRAAFGNRGVRTFDFADPFNTQQTGVHNDLFPFVTRMHIVGGGTGVDWWAGGRAGLMSMNTTNPSAVGTYWTLKTL